jgi:hypothetical protein
MSDDAIDLPSDTSIEATLTVRRVADPLGEQVVDAWIVEPDQISVSRDEVRAILREITLNPETGYSEPYVLTETRTEFEWGASAEAFNYLIEIFQDVPKEILYTSLGVAVDRLIGRLMREPVGEPIDVGAADSKARQALARTFKIDAGSLECIGEEIEGTGSSVSLSYRAMTGTAFSAKIERIGKLALCTYVSRLRD